MKTLTLTPNDARNLHIPATEELLRGWVGPADYLGESVACGGIVSGTPPIWVDIAHCAGYSQCQIDHLRLPLSRPKVIDQMYRVFAAGVWCGDCKGSGVCPSLHDDPHPCHECDGSLWFRPPTDLSHFRGVKAEGWGPEMEAALLWVSWVRMAGGMEPIEEAYTLTRDGYRQAVTGDHERCPWVKRGVRQAVSDFEEGILAEGHALLDITPEGPTLRALVP